MPSKVRAMNRQGPGLGKVGSPTLALSTRQAQEKRHINEGLNGVVAFTVNG